jgi:hypothetical protein
MAQACRERGLNPEDLARKLKLVAEVASGDAERWLVRRLAAGQVLQTRLQVGGQTCGSEQ